MVDDGKAKDGIVEAEDFRGEDPSPQLGRADPVACEPDTVMHVAVAPEERKVRARDVDRPAPASLQPDVVEHREQAPEPLRRDADPLLEPCVPRPDRGAGGGLNPADAQGDPAIRRRPEVVKRRAVIPDALPPGPPDRGPTLGRGFGEDDV